MGLKECIDPTGAGSLLDDAKCGLLNEPQRAEDQRHFFDEHMGACAACREAMLDHANEFAFGEVARRRGLSKEQFTQQLLKEGSQLEEEANRRGISLKELISERNQAS
jgi:predicted anti-sigma-YlaC factor YlaD